MQITKHYIGSGQIADKLQLGCINPPANVLPCHYILIVRRKASFSIVHTLRSTSSSHWTGEDMMTLLVFLELLIIFNIAAWKWGVDSTDGINSPEWERRQSWNGFH